MCERGGHGKGCVGRGGGVLGGGEVLASVVSSDLPRFNRALVWARHMHPHREEFSLPAPSLCPGASYCPRDLSSVKASPPHRHPGQAFLSCASKPTLSPWA